MLQGYVGFPSKLRRMVLFFFLTNTPIVPEELAPISRVKSPQFIYFRPFRGVITYNPIYNDRRGPPCTAITKDRSLGIHHPKGLEFNNSK